MSNEGKKEKEYIFRCKTNEGFIFKVLIELLHNNIKTACFEISEKKIFLRMMDSNRRTLIDVQLYAENFNLFLLQNQFGTKCLNIGINLNHFYKMLKSIKKKDCLVLFIAEDQPTDLGIQIIPKDFSRITTSFIKIQNIQNLEVALPENYSRTILVSSNEFSKMCKDMFNLSNTILISAKKYSVTFLCNVGSVYSREVMLGETDPECATENESISCLSDDYDTEQLARIIKISGLSSSLQLLFHSEMPLCISSKVGQLGSISIFIKSRQQLQQEQIENEL